MPRVRSEAEHGPIRRCRVKLKLDENLSRRSAERFRTAGHDVHTVTDEGLSGASDIAVLAAAVDEGFARAGLGTAPLFPLAFHAAGDLPGVSTGDGVAAVAWMGRIGFLVAPPLVGLIGDAVNLRAGLVLVPIAGSVVALLAGALASDRDRGIAAAG